MQPTFWHICSILQIPLMILFRVGEEKPKPWKIRTLSLFLGQANGERVGICQDFYTMFRSSF